MKRYLKYLRERERERERERATHLGSNYLIILPLLIEFILTFLFMNGHPLKYKIIFYMLFC